MQRLNKLAAAPAAVLVVQLVTGLAFLIAWDFAARHVIDKQFISPPATVAAGLPSLLGDSAILEALFVTFIELTVAFVVAVALGVAIAVAIGLNEAVFEAAYPIVLLVYAIPQITLLPLFVLYLGVGPASKIAFGISHGILPIVVTVAAAVRGFDRKYVRLAKCSGASASQIVRTIVLKQIAPSLFASLKLAMAATLIGVLLAELYVSHSGIGFFTRSFANSFAPTKLFGLIVLLASMAVLLNGSVDWIERLLDPRLRRSAES